MNKQLQERIASTALLMLAILVFVSVLLRYFLNWPIPDTLDFSRILLSIVVLWGIALVIVEDTHIQVDLLWKHLNPTSRKILTVFNRILMTIFACLFAALIVEHVWQLSQNGKQTVDYRLPLWVFYLILLPTGMVAVVASLKHLFSKAKHEALDD